MKSLRHFWLIPLSMMLVVFIAACGADANASSAAKTGTTSANQPVQSNAQNTDQKTAQTSQQSNNISANQNNNQANTQTSNQTASNNAAQHNQQSTTQNKQQTSTQKVQSASSQNDQSSKDQTSAKSNNDNSNNQSNDQSYNGNNQNNGQTTSNGNTLVKTKQVTLNGQAVNVLTTFDGMTLYYRSSDPAPDSTCTGNCAQVWPPLISKGNVFSVTVITGTLTMQTTANGSQVEFNGHPLYTYSGDNAPGQVNGQGVGNVWYVVKVMNGAVHW